MRKIKKLSITVVALSLLVTFLFTGCSNTVIYQVEKDINAYVNKMTEGYSRMSDAPTTKTYTLYKEDKVLEIKLKQGLNSAPSIDITTGKTKKKTTENNILTITQTINGTETIYGSASAFSLYFNPYENAFVPCMRVYKKNPNTYRVLLTVINDGNDMYPFYKALTSSDYEKLLEASEKYDKQLEKTFSSYATDDYGNQVEIPDYSDEFSQMFVPFSSLSKEEKEPILKKFPLIAEQNGYVLYELGEDYADYLETVFPDFAGFNMQSARHGYTAMGYTDYNLNCIIVTIDVVISQDGSSYEISMADEIYYSPTAIANDAEYTFSFCETLNAIE